MWSPNDERIHDLRWIQICALNAGSNDVDGSIQLEPCLVGTRGQTNFNAIQVIERCEKRGSVLWNPTNGPRQTLDRPSGDSDQKNG